MNETETPVDYVVLTADIVAAYVSNNPVPAAELGHLIGSIHGALIQVGTGRVAPQAAAAEPLQPAVPIKKSIQPDYLVCLEDGKQMKMLKRHLRNYHDMTPDQYRQKWGLNSDYPMVAPNYAETRRTLAKSFGLGIKGRIKDKAK